MVFSQFPKLLTGLLCLFCTALYSQSPTFQKIYNGPGEDIANDILETADGYLIAGETFNPANGHKDALLIHTDKSGAVLWKKTYGQFDEDAFDRIRPANDGGLIVWGYTRDFNNNRTDAWLVKLDDSGHLLWQKTIGTPGFSNTPIGQIVAMPDGYILSGYKTKPGYFQSFTTRVDNDGLTVWSQFTPSDVFSTASVQYLADSLLYLTGTANFLSAWRTMDPATGAIVQSREYQADTSTWSYEMHRTPEGDHLMTGMTIRDVPGLPRYDSWAQKVNSAGQVLWSKAYQVAERSYINTDASIVLSDGSCVMGISYILPGSNSSLERTVLVKIDTHGAVVWARGFGSNETIFLNRIIQTTDGGLMAAGYAGPDSERDAWWMKMDSMGIVEGCCVANIHIVVQDLLPKMLELPFSATPYESTVPYLNAEADTAAWELETYCSNTQPLVNRSLAFCPSQPVTLGDSTYSQAGVVTVILPSTTYGCDTIATYTLELLPQPAISQTITFCPGETVTLGDSTYSQPGIVTLNLPADSIGCDTIATYTLEWLPQPTVSRTITFCPGGSVTLGDSTYTQPGIVPLTLPATTGGCDTLAVYTLTWLEQPMVSRTLAFCPGESLTLGDSSYTQPGTVTLHLPATTGGCDTLATYVLEWLNQPAISRTILFCPGEMVTIQDSIYTQPTTVTVHIPAVTGGCDTLATYILAYESTNQQSTVSLTCPANQTVVAAPGAGAVAVAYTLPVVESNCSCPGIVVDLTGGGASGSLFPLGVQTVCYRAEDVCGQSKTCCFTVNVVEESTCDVKTNGCVKFELVGIQRDASQNWVYRVRITNQCSSGSELSYAYLQVPTGVQAVAPANNSVYTGPSGAGYTVRNPNFSPFYAVRFQPLTTGLVNGQSDVFRYVLPAQTEVDYIHVAVRLASGAYVEALLNTFNCPVGTENFNRITDRNSTGAAAVSLAVFPNPATANGTLTITGSDIPEGVFLLQDVMGRTVLQNRILENQLRLDRAGLAAGVYFFKIIAGGQFAGSGKISLF